MTAIPTNDAELMKFIKENLTVAAVCDALDSVGLRHQAMHSRLRPLDTDFDKCRVIGRARTAQMMDTDYVFEDDPYGDEITLLDDLQENDVVVFSTDMRGESATWGELLTTVAMRNGASGAIVDTKIRDAAQIKELGFPVFQTGFRPYDSKGRSRVMAYDVPVRCGEVVVNKNDIVFGDADGVIVVPHDIEREVLEKAFAKVTAENVSRKELKEGCTMRAVYDKYGIL